MAGYSVDCEIYVFKGKEYVEQTYAWGGRIY